VQGCMRVTRMVAIGKDALTVKDDGKQCWQGCQGKDRQGRLSIESRQGRFEYQGRLHRKWIIIQSITL
jgi:hypothetical protein